MTTKRGTGGRRATGNRSARPAPRRKAGRPGRPKPRLSAAAAVRRAVAGTLNREVDVNVTRQAGERWAVSIVVRGTCSPVILVNRREMDAMKQVPLVPAHLRGHFLRNYVNLEKSPKD